MKFDNMKLYATTTSERASKGQGGNQYLDIIITGKDEQLAPIIAKIQLWEEEGQFFIKYEDCCGNDVYQNISKNEKGNKQKGIAHEESEENRYRKG